MEQLSSTDSITLEAFQAALDTCTERGIELPAAIQAVAPDLQSHINELDDLSELDATFEAFYQAERLAIQHSAARSKKRFSSTEAPPPIADNLVPISVARTQFTEKTKGTAHPQVQPDQSSNNYLATDPTTTSAQTTDTESSPPSAQPPSEPAPPSLQRFVLPDDATEGDLQYFQTYIEELKQLNPGWKLLRDRCRPGEHEAYVMIRDDEEYQVNYAAYLTSQLINEFFSELSL